MTGGPRSTWWLPCVAGFSSSLRCFASSGRRLAASAPREYSPRVRENRVLGFPRLRHSPLSSAPLLFPQTLPRRRPAGALPAHARALRPGLYAGARRQPRARELAAFPRDPRRPQPRRAHLRFALRRPRGLRPPDAGCRAPARLLGAGAWRARWLCVQAPRHRRGDGAGSRLQRRPLQRLLSHGHWRASGTW